MRRLRASWLPRRGHCRLPASQQLQPFDCWCGPLGCVFNSQYCFSCCLLPVFVSTCFQSHREVTRRASGNDTSSKLPTQRSLRNIVPTMSMISSRRLVAAPRIALRPCVRPGVSCVAEVFPLSGLQKTALFWGRRARDRAHSAEQRRSMHVSAFLHSLSIFET